MTRASGDVPGNPALWLRLLDRYLPRSARKALTGRFGDADAYRRARTARGNPETKPDSPIAAQAYIWGAKRGFRVKAGGRDASRENFDV